MDVPVEGRMGKKMDCGNREEWLRTKGRVRANIETMTIVVRGQLHFFKDDK